MVSVMDLLRKGNRGRLLEGLERDLSECLEAVKESGKGGEIVLRIRIKPADKDTQMVIVDPSHTARLPRRPTAPAFYFVTAHGLSERDPRQPQLPGEMRVVVGQEEDVDGKSAAAGER